MLEHSYWIALLPALSFPINLARKYKEPVPAYIGLALITLSWLWSVALFVTTLGQQTAYQHSWAWIPLANGALKLGFQVDHLTIMMLLVVTTVSALVQLYSIGYMHADKRFNVYYAYLGLFTASMLLLVLADNWLLMMIAWELVGVSSYQLIGFWFEKPSAMKAAKKAFIVTRFADLGFLAGVMILWNTFHTFSFVEVRAMLDPTNPGMIWAAGAAAMFLFCGAVGKSAQFPLHVWLPDAMEGPTPVSALIHAATMVAAGVYLVGRSFFLFEYGSLHTFQWNLLVTIIGVTPLGFVRFLGVCTLIIAATIALVQNDIKRVLAYSTVSQLGYMVMAIGLGSWVAGLFHLMTHAAFKALLFLGSGSVIHGTGTQDMREMGGLRSKMPWTFWTYMIGFLALAGFPFIFAGFWSKDAILDGAKLLSHQGQGWFLILGSIGAFLTPFYMTRQMYMVFDGKTRNPGLHIHESGKAMLAPLVLLAIPAVAAGWLGVPKHNLFKDYLDPKPAIVAEAREAPELPKYLVGADLTMAGVDPALRAVHAPEEHPKGALFEMTGLNPAVAVPSMLIVLAALALGIIVYKKAVEDSQVKAARYAKDTGLVDAHGHVHEHGHAHGQAPDIDPAGFWLEPLKVMGPVHTFLLNKWYFDELYDVILWTPCKIIAEISNAFDRHVVDGLVNGTGRLGLLIGDGIRLVDKWVVDGFVNLTGIVPRWAGSKLRLMQTGKVQNYAVALYVGALLLIAVGLLRLPHR